MIDRGVVMPFLLVGAAMVDARITCIRELVDQGNCPREAPQHVSESVRAKSLTSDSDSTRSSRSDAFGHVDIRLP